MPEKLVDIINKSYTFPEPDTKMPQLVVRPYNMHEKRLTLGWKKESRFETLVRLIVTSMIDRRRYEEASLVEPRGVELARKKHFDRLIESRESFIAGFVEVFEITSEEHERAVTIAESSFAAIKRGEELNL